MLLQIDFENLDLLRLAASDETRQSLENYL